MHYFEIIIVICFNNFDVQLPCHERSLDNKYLCIKQDQIRIILSFKNRILIIVLHISNTKYHTIHLFYVGKKRIWREKTNIFMYKCYVSVILTFKAIVLFTYVTTFSSLSMFIVHYTVHTYPYFIKLYKWWNFCKRRPDVSVTQVYFCKRRPDVSVTQVYFFTLS